MEVVVFGRTQTQRNAFLRTTTTVLCRLNAFHREDTDQILFALGLERSKDWEKIEIDKYTTGWKAPVKPQTK
jgi:hypothetical protein